MYTPEEVIVIIKKIFEKAGYDAEFKDLDISLEKKNFIFTGNYKFKQHLKEALEGMRKVPPSMDKLKEMGLTLTALEGATQVVEFHSYNNCLDDIKKLIDKQ